MQPLQEKSQKVNIIIKISMIKYIIDVGMGISFFICLITGLMKWPDKTLGRIIHSSEITIIHDYSGILLGLFVLIHLILNWKWIKNMTKKVFSKNS